MPRPSRNIDAKLISLGKKKMLELGVANFSVRHLCMESGINLGMFCYYFKTKENFIRIVLQSLSDDLQVYWYRETAGIANPVEKLKKVLNVNVRLFREQRGAFQTLFKDLDLTNKVYVKLFNDIHRTWIDFYTGLIEECKKMSFLDKNIENEKYAAIFFGSMLTYSRVCEVQDAKTFYEKSAEVIDLLVSRFQ